MNGTPGLARVNAIEVKDDPRLSRGTKEFLKMLNSGGGPPLETLPPLDAREVLVGAQSAVAVSSTIPESKTVARGGLTNAAKVDFAKPHAPLLLTSGSTDHIIPAHLNLRNSKKYKKSDSVLDYKEFPGRNHFVVGQPTWKEDADYILNWIAKQQGRGIVTGFLNLKEIVKPIDSPKVHVARVRKNGAACPSQDGFEMRSRRG